MLSEFVEYPEISTVNLSWGSEWKWSICAEATHLSHTRYLECLLRFHIYSHTYIHKLKVLNAERSSSHIYIHKYTQKLKNLCTKGTIVGEYKHTYVNTYILRCYCQLRNIFKIQSSKYLYTYIPFLSGLRTNLTFLGRREDDTSISFCLIFFATSTRDLIWVRLKHIYQQLQYECMNIIYVCTFVCMYVCINVCLGDAICM